MEIKNFHSRDDFVLAAAIRAEKLTLDDVTSDVSVTVKGTTITDGDLKIKNSSSKLIVEDNIVEKGNLVVEKISTTTTTVTTPDVDDIIITGNTVSGNDDNLKIKDLNIGGKLTIQNNQVEDGYLIVEDNVIGGAYVMQDNVLSKGLAWKDTIAASY